MARRSGLGKGLGALIPNEVVGDRVLRGSWTIPCNRLSSPTRLQPRTSFDEDTLAVALPSSIRACWGAPAGTCEAHVRWRFTSS